MQTTPVSIEKTQERTQGRQAGPITAGTAVGAMLITVLTFTLTALGVVVPPDVVAAVVGLLLTGVVWFARGRKEVEVITVAPQPLEEGTGSHVATSSDVVIPGQQELPLSTQGEQGAGINIWANDTVQELPLSTQGEQGAGVGVWLNEYLTIQEQPTPDKLLLTESDKIVENYSALERLKNYIK